MRITIQSTPDTHNVDGVPTRVWRGVTERGVKVLVLVHRLVVARPDEERFRLEMAGIEEVDAPRMEAKLTSRPPRELLRP